MKILVCDDLPESGLKQLREIPNSTLDVKTGLSEAQLIETVPEYGAVLVRSSTKITEPVLKAAKNLKVIVRAGMGYDNIDIAAATNHGVAVMNTPGSNAVTTAEHAIAMMMALARNIPQAYQKLRSGKWDKKSFVGTELSGKCLGVIGLGNVGRHVARRACGLKMKVLGYDPYIPEKVAKEAGVVVTELDELFAKSDIITLHTTLTDSTRHLIGAKAFQKMKDGVRIINCARGGIVDENALLEALNQKKVAGAALDVFEKEPIPSDHPLLSHDRVIVTPHLGASTQEAQQQVVTAAASQLQTYLVHDIVINGVNVRSVSQDVLAALGHYLDLATHLGSFLGQIEMPPVEEFLVECSGEITKNDTSPIALAALQGFLQHFSSAHVNIVNAPIIAKERGIRMVESRTDDAGNYLSLITVTARSKDESHLVSGSVFGLDHERLIRFDNFYLEVKPVGHLVVIHNEDKPGVVGAWGTILGKNKINISQMQVALDPKKNEALSIVNVDTPAPAHVIDELGSVMNIQTVTQMKL